MRTIPWVGVVFVVACAIALDACQAASPASPSSGAPSLISGARTLADEGDPTVPTPPPAKQITIVGTFGLGAFNPNPVQAVVGDMIVWTNMDTRTHRIALDDGTDLGVIEPGSSTAPVALATPTVGYHCVLHPSMVGTISTDAVPPTAPPYPAEPPPGEPGYYRAR